MKELMNMIELKSYLIRISDEKTSIGIVFEFIYEDVDEKNEKIKFFIKGW